jgi:hypothetical protein
MAPGNSLDPQLYNMTLTVIIDAPGHQVNLCKTGG